MQNRFLYIIFLLFTFFTGCMFFNKSVDELYPEESKLTFDIFKKCERFIIDENYFILQINTRDETEYYEPYLMFYKKNNLRLEFKVYNPGKVVSIKDSIVSGLYNENRSEAQKNKLENGYLFLFDKKEPANSRNMIKGNVSLFKVENDSVFLQVNKDPSVIKYHVNQIVFSPLRKNNIEIYNYSKKILIYNYYEVDEFELKKEVWEKFISKI